MNTIYLVIANAGDGSSYVEFYCDPASIKYLEDCLNTGNCDRYLLEKYASGDGLQVTKIVVPCDLDKWASIQPNWFGWADEYLVENSDGI